MEPPNLSPPTSVNASLWPRFLRLEKKIFGVDLPGFGRSLAPCLGGQGLEAAWFSRKMGAFSSSAMPNTDLFQFLKGSIRSVWALELLLLMRASGGRVWRPDELVSELRASAPLVSGVLRTFHDAGLIREEAGAFVYAPASPTLEAYCEELEKAYRERPVAVINAIVASSTDDLQSFADAFRFRGGK